MDFVSIVVILAGFYVGWNIGANFGANWIGTTVGAQIVSFRKAALLMGIFVFLGRALQGHHVMKTVGKGIVITTEEAFEERNGEPPPPEFRAAFPEEKLPDLALFVALVSAGLVVTLATFSMVPVSTSQAIVGGVGVGGVGLGLVGVQASYFKLGEPLKILDVGSSARS